MQANFARILLDSEGKIRIAHTINHSKYRKKLGKIWAILYNCTTIDWM